MSRRRGPATACASFPPIAGRAPRVLVLGSMPGARSLAEQRYYANPHNHFWRFIGGICGFDPAAPYTTRIAQLKRCGIAVWDVLAQCERSGSLDGGIVRDTEVPNEIAAFVARHRSLRAIALNGGKAAQSFRRYIRDALSDEDRARVLVLELPSTSPANASVPLARKLAAWSRVGAILRDVAPRRERTRRKAGHD
ncbi:MAG TPA: DNA-deoxyinosine glycosylase [Candidatus Saccharimonadia bacterium]|nr:DNA-deoxyinosine glycosylase [Candidatus Saccharimonadia bacterium]